MIDIFFVGLAVALVLVFEVYDITMKMFRFVFKRRNV